MDKVTRKRPRAVFRLGSPAGVYLNAASRGGADLRKEVQHFRLLTQKQTSKLHRLAAL
jgi:hypothetical protein